MSASIGQMRHRLAIDEAVAAADGGGGSTVTWSEVAVVWAGIRPVSAVEHTEAHGLQGRVTHEITLRWRGDVSPRMRLRMGPRLFDVKGVIDRNEAHRFLRCLVEERIG